ncbi:MAG: hypothetical protein L0154_25000 [Chloroflexi bacterium]|nr:hypothetical protein [Chloroflexota bacterium]
MDYFIDWLIPNQIIYTRWPEDVTMEMMEDVNEMAVEMMDEAAPYTDKIHLLIDARATETIPMNLFDLRKAMDVYDHPNCGWSWTLSNSKVITFLASSVPQMVTHVRFKVFSDVGQMMYFIQGVDPEFTPDNMNPWLLHRLAE